MIQQLHTLRNIWYPERYHGAMQRSGFFEGWYYKFDDRHSQVTCAVIVGISMNGVGDQEAFIQFVDGSTHQSSYHRFRSNEFYASANDFYIKLGANEFGANRIELDLPNLKAELSFDHHEKWDKSILAPNIMGILSYFPFLECNHGLISMRNEVSGYVIQGEVKKDFDGGRGYIEKDWGASFPRAHIWLQSNRFEHPDTSLSVAIAKIPIAGAEVTGFAAVLIWKGKRYLFSTYNLSKVHITSKHTAVELLLTGLNYQLCIQSTYNDSVQLVTPNTSGMKGVVKESLGAEVTITLSEKNASKPIYQDRGINAGIEIAGEW